MYQHQSDLSPIEVAIDEMSAKVGELRLLCSASEVDMIRLQLKLQGSISVQVRKGLVILKGRKTVKTSRFFFFVRSTQVLLLTPEPF